MIVITAPPQRGESTEVDPALVAYFSSLQLSPNAVADWDVRNVDWRGPLGISTVIAVMTAMGWGFDSDSLVTNGREDSVGRLG